MSHQGEDGWYPCCAKCGMCNLGSEVVCIDCYNKLIDNMQKQLNELKKLINDK